jgi:hypothetical protein
MTTPANREELIAAVLPPAMELATAYTAADDDPALFWDTMRRAVHDAGADDPAAGTAQLLFGLSALSGILLDRIADLTGQDKSHVLAEIHQLYLPS